MTDLKIPKISNAEFLVNFEMALQWMQSLGIDISKGRLAEYKNAARSWVALLNREQEQLADSDMHANVTSMAFEVPAFVDIYAAFKEEKPANLSGLIAKLRKAVAGPSQLASETSTSTGPRNFLFEAVTAAKVHNPSMNVTAILNAPSDTGFKMLGKNFWIECKRLSAEGQVLPNISKACKQLQRTLEMHPQTGQRGIIALDISKLVTPPPPKYILEVAVESEIGPYTNHIVDNYIRDHAYVWQQKFLNQDSRIIGALLRLSCIATTKDRRAYIYVQQWGINPRNNATLDDQRLMKEMVNKLNPQRELRLAKSLY
ncbi:MAG: hypothetical protein V4805_04565 [Pseudomonadota bacterium]